jgi:hypothetical protein
VSVVSPPRAETFYCPPQQLDGGAFGEQVDWWLKLANAMRAAVDTASRLKVAERPARADLVVLRRCLLHGISPNPKIEGIVKGSVDIWAPPEGEGRVDASRARAWTLVLELLNKWLQACPMRLHFTFTDAVPHRVDFSMSFIASDQRGCFPALVFELAGRVRGVDDRFMVRCAHCDDPFVPRREPSEGQRAFCPACRREGWPTKYALRNYYANHRVKILRRRKLKRRQGSNQRG